MHTILDLDLDFFVWPIERDRAEDEPRLDEKEFAPQSAEQVREFLEKRCGLSTTRPIPGRFVVHHVDAFTTWRDWLGNGALSQPFDVVHVDAHADLGAGWNQSAKFYETELLALPLEQRGSPQVGTDSTNSGNYLVAAVANRWIRSLTYVYPTEPKPPDPEEIRKSQAMENLRQFLSDDNEDERYPNDLAPFCFKDWNPRTRTIQLREYSRSHYSLVDRNTAPVHVEPEVPFDWKKAEEFTFSDFTHFVVAQSPAYTPAAADPLLEVIREYFTPA